MMLGLRPHYTSHLSVRKIQRMLCGLLMLVLIAEAFQFGAVSVRTSSIPGCSNIQSLSFRSFSLNAAFRRRSNGRPTSSPVGDITDRLNFQKIIKIDPKFQALIQDLNCTDITKNTLLKKGFTHLTPIQSQSFEPIIAGEDIIGRSRTGTGKTLAFGIPIIEQIIQHPVIKRRKEEESSQTGWRDRRSSGGSRKPLVLILEPTRELALQVAQELSNVGVGHSLRVSCVYGGSSFLKQEEDLRFPGCDIIVATPGRLLDHIQQHTIDLSQIHHIVLDEGDTMLEMGFQEDVESILQTVQMTKQKKKSENAEDHHSTSSASTALDKEGGKQQSTASLSSSSSSLQSNKSKSKELQMLLFSATMPSWIVSMTNRLMREPIFLDAIQEGETRLASTIKHYSILLPNPEDEAGSSNSNARRGGRGRDRVDQIASFIEDIILTRALPSSGGSPSSSTGSGGTRRGQQTIIFTNTKEEADRLASMHCFQYFSSQVLHGDISQYLRQRTLSLFRQQYLDILISTDVAARGLDIQGVDLVIHLSPPRDVDSYVHRSGRTGRAGRNGTSICFYSKPEQAMMQVLQKKLKFSFQSIGLPLPSEICASCAQIVEQKLANVEEGSVQYFLPYAKQLLEMQQQEWAKTMSKKEKTSSIAAVAVVEEEEVSSSLLEKPKLGPSLEELLSRCMAAISQRYSLTTRSLLTGKDGFLTLAFQGSFINRNTPEVWDKFLIYYLSKTLGIDRFHQTSRLPSRIYFAMNDSQPMLLVDFEDDFGQEILHRFKQVKAADRSHVMSSNKSSAMEEVIVRPCTALPDYVQWDGTSSASSYSSTSSSYSSRVSSRSSDYRGNRGRGRGGETTRRWRSSAEESSRSSSSSSSSSSDSSSYPGYGRRGRDSRDFRESSSSSGSSQRGERAGDAWPRRSRGGEEGGDYGRRGSGGRRGERGY